ncbi:MAG: transmembrane anchor protein [Calditrichaeota bacterium]|nr:MAG: transmembrane anchor protein [Calditrichota bacterium]
MKNKNIPTNADLPSMQKLIKSTIIAICIASIILITVVLPAEYGVDPTGIGSVLGLTTMGEIKVSLAHEAAAEKNLENLKVEIPEQKTAVKKSIPEVENSESSNQSESFTFSLKPNEGKEIKLTMAKDAQVDFHWSSNGGKVNFDTHADSKALEIKYHNYEKGSTTESKGILKAAFDGNHGWFWRNRTSKEVLVTLNVQGDFSAVVEY